MSIYNYSRRRTLPVRVGRITIGGDAPIAIQSMTNTDTNDTDACVAQIKTIADAGADLVRLTTQGVREASNLENTTKGFPCRPTCISTPKLRSKPPSMPTRCASIPATSSTRHARSGN